jgi:hypothetical protein
MFPLAERYAAMAAAFLLIASPTGVAQIPPSQEIHTEMRNVSYHYTDRIAIQIQMLQGTLAPTQPGHVPVFDDTQSFEIHVTSAQVFVTVDSMAHMLNDYVLTRKDAPIKDISIQTQGNSLIVKGKKGALPFEATTILNLTPDGEIVLHTEKVRVAHLPVKGMMDLLGLEMADLINTKKIRGVRSDGNDLILNTEKVLPPPHIQGKISSVRVQGDNIVETIGTPEKSKPLMKGNYMSYRGGGSLGFGKLTMADTDLVLIDMDAKDPFDFYFQRYKEQLVAGYSKTTTNFGLRVYMRDFNKLPIQARAPAGKYSSVPNSQ